MRPLRLARLGAVPHEEDWWVSTDDALDYARWLNRNVTQLDVAWQRALTSVPTAQTFGLEWIPWLAQWRAEHAALETGWWDRVNSWDKIKQRHVELVALRAKAIAAGVDAPELDTVPKDPEERWGETVVDGVAKAGAASQTLTLVVGVAAVAALIYVLKK